MNLIQPDHVALGDEHSALFETVAERIRADGYVVIPNALPDDLGQALMQHVRNLDAHEFQKAGVGRLGDHQKNAFVRRDDIRWIEGDNLAEILWLRWATQLQQYLNRQLLLGLFSFESHFAHYGVGAFYKKHLDAFRGEANRVLSIVIYLNPGWLPEDGGELVIYSNGDNNQIVTKVTPAFSTLVAFLSEEFPHEVLPANRTRYSIAGWYRVNHSALPLM